MNTIEFGIEDGVPYAIDFLNPAPDFERDRITPHYFDLVLDRMSKLVRRSRAQRPADESVAAVGADARLGQDVRVRRPAAVATVTR